MSSTRDIVQVRATLAKFTRGLCKLGCYQTAVDVAHVVVFVDGRGHLRLANETGSDTTVELPKESFIGQYTDDLEFSSSLSPYTQIANGCAIKFIEMVKIGNTVYPIYLATGRVQVAGHCVNLTHSSPGCFTTCKGRIITMGPVAAALFNPRV